MPHKELQLPTRRAAALALWLLSGAVAVFPVEFFPQEEVRPGLSGIGTSVFRGTAIDTFHVEIIGLERNRLRPGKNLIIARLSGAGLEETGVIRGMSGSPVYIDGRLLGAVSYGWAFSKEPICGITPIADMLAVMERSLEPGEENGNPGTLRGPERRERQAHQGPLEPLATPLSLSGFSPAAARILDEFMAEHGFTIASGPAAGEQSGPADAAPMQPGAAMGVPFVSGDFSAVAIGTLTHRDGDRLVGLGHPLLELGAVDLPLSGALIHAVMPSRFASFKLGAAGKVIGAVRQDRWAGVAGVAGARASVLPLALELSGTTERERYSFELLRHDLLTPLLAQVVILSALEPAASLTGESSLIADATLYLENGARVERSDLYAGRAAVFDAARELAEPLRLTLGGPFERIGVDSLDLAVEVAEGSRHAEIAEARLAAGAASPGDAVSVRVLLRPHRKPEEEQVVEVHIPRTAVSGPVQVRVGSGRSARAWEMARLPDGFRPRNNEQLIRMLNRSARRDDLVIELFRPEAAMSVDGRELPGLPPSAYAVLSADAGSGRVAPVSGRVVARSQVRTRYALAGERTLPLEIRRRAAE